MLPIGSEQSFQYFKKNDRSIILSGPVDIENKLLRYRADIFLKNKKKTALTLIFNISKGQKESQAKDIVFNFLDIFDMLNQSKTEQPK